MRGGDSVTHQLTKKLQHLKKKIKQFEEQFEKERNYKVRSRCWSRTLLSLYVGHSCETLAASRYTSNCSKPKLCN